MYVGNNPVNYVDPTGHWAFPAQLIGGGLFVALGAGIAILTAPVSVPIIVLGGAVGLATWALFGDVFEDIVFSSSYEEAYEDDYDDTWDDYEDQCKPQKGPSRRPDNSNKQVDDAGTDEGLSKEDLYDFRRHVEETKASEGRCGSDNYTYKELRRMARDWKKGSR